MNGVNLDNSILVSIHCLVYNHEPYLRDCLEGFVMQKTNFRFDAIVHDDASTDGSGAIIREYAEKYPDIIKPIFEIENQYSKQDGSLEYIMNNATKGKYVAYCEGDDYWINPNKLQKQIDFLESHKECSACFGNFLTRTMYNGSRTKMKHRKTYYDLHDVLSGKMFGLQNLCLRREVINVPIKTSQEDVLIYLQCAVHGKIGYIDEDFAVYRITGSGVATRWTPEELIGLKCNAYYKLQKHNDICDDRAFVKLLVFDFLQDIVVNRRDFLKKAKLLNKYEIPVFKKFIWMPFYIFEFFLITIWNKLRYPHTIISKI